MARPFSPERATRAARRLVIVMIGLVVSFATATAMQQSRETAIDRHVEAILDDAMPSVQHLSRMRSRLERLLTTVAMYARTDGHEGSPATIAAARRSLDDPLDLYLATPIDPGEAELQVELSDGLAAFDEVTARIEERVDRGDGAAADALVLELAARANTTETAIARLIDLNARVGLEQARQIEATRVASMRAALVIDGLGIVLGLLAVVLAMRAIQRTVRLGEEQRRAAEERAVILAERASELGQFGGRVAHDVLSPLTSVGLALEVAHRRSSDDRTQLMVRRGQSSLDRVRRIVDGLLEFARAGAPPDRRARTAVEEVVRDVVDGARSEADAADVQMSIESMAAVTVACSPGVLTSLAANLVRNAIKYTSDAPVRRVAVRVMARRGRCRVEVADTGPGIPPSLVEAVFEPYVRAGSRSLPGIGLGLATVKRLAQAHGGTTGVTSTVGNGSTFWFELPLAEAPPPTEIAPAPSD